ncbi:MAG: GntR family transcriptional regulator [Bacteroidales bacterium]|nr:GntR family transcriptional regulator [Bacteroidales bacterium]
MEIDHKSSVPLHAQVEQMLRTLIELPEYKEGKFLPNEVDMAKQLGISRNTVRQAINRLVYEGLLVRKNGVGTKVVDKSVNTRLSNWLSFTQEMKAKGIAIKNYELTLDWVEPDKALIEFFNLKKAEPILRMQRLRGNKSHPFVFFISYFHPRIGLTEQEDFTRPLYEILEQDHAVVAKLSREEISALSADEFLAEKLKVNAEKPILKRKRYVFDPGNRPIEYNLGYYRADSFIYTIESERSIQ